MPDLSWNKSYWDGDYDWKERGEEWSECWGGSESQWFGSLYPRLHRFLPTENVFEIAPGYGRWTRYLMQYTRGCYQGIDVSEACIEYCKKTFCRDEKALFSVNNGLTLEMAADASFDLVFSFDSLVHAEIDVLEAYIPQIVKKLKSDGVAFIHHSNWATAGTTEPEHNTHCRAESVSAEAVGEIVIQNGGRVILQECLNWGTDKLIDAFTLFCRKERQRGTKPVRVDNSRFMLEASILKDVYSKYSVR